MSGNCIQCRIANIDNPCPHVGEINPEERATLNKLLSETLGTRYELVSRLGAGAFGDVFKALDTSLDRDVAIKRVRLDTFTDPANREEVKNRFIREAKLAARLNHPNIVTIYDIANASSAHFIIMEFVDGPTLQHEIKRKKRLALDETIEILSQAASALDHAHQRTIVHRDVTPANIMLESSRWVKVADFGTARSETSSNITTTGIILGTPNYMSPEQARGETTIDRRTDLFSLGCILYECLSGIKPFLAESQIATLMRIVNEGPPKLDHEALGLHHDINDLMSKALAKDPNKRFASATELVQALKALPKQEVRAQVETDTDMIELQEEHIESKTVRTKVEKVAAKPEKVEAKQAKVEPKDEEKAAKAEPKAETTQPKAAKADPKVEKVEAKTEKAEAKPAKVESKVEKAEAEPAKVESKVEKAEAEPAKVEPKVEEAEAKTEKEDKEEKVEAKAEKVEPKPEKAETKPGKVEKHKGQARKEPRAPLPVTRRDPNQKSFFDTHLQGKLSENALAEVIRELYTNRKTGILHIEKEETCKRIYFKKGSIVFANSDVNEDRLGEFLIRSGEIDRKAFERSSQVSKEIGQRFGKTLTELGYVTGEKLEEKVIEQVLTIIYSLFDWVDGEYRFEQLEKPVEEDITVRLSTADTILEGIRRMDSPEMMRAALGSLNRVLCHSDNPLLLYQKVSLTPEEGFVLSRVDGMTTVGEAAAISPLGEDETLRCIYGLVAAGVLILQEKEGSRSDRMRRLEKESVELPKPEAEIKEGKPKEQAKASKVGSKLDERAIHDEITAKHASLATVTHYELLEISSTASEAEIKRSYYAMVKKYHPDRHHSPHLKDVHGLLEELVVKITSAYQVLSDAAGRKRYDQVVIRDEKTEVSVNPEQSLRYAAAGSGTSGSASPGSVAKAHYREGKRRFDDMSYFDAIQCLQQAVQLDPNKAPYQALLAEALSKNPHWRKEAEEHYLKAIELDPMNVDCYLGLGEIYDNLGLSSRSQKMYTKVLKLDPGNETAHEKMNGVKKNGNSTLNSLKNILKKKRT